MIPNSLIFIFCKIKHTHAKMQALNCESNMQFVLHSKNYVWNHWDTHLNSTPSFSSGNLSTNYSTNTMSTVGPLEHRTIVVYVGGMRQTGKTTFIQSFLKNCKVEETETLNNESSRHITMRIENVYYNLKVVDCQNTIHGHQWHNMRTFIATFNIGNMASFQGKQTHAVHFHFFFFCIIFFVAFMRLYFFFQFVCAKKKIQIPRVENRIDGNVSTDEKRSSIVDILQLNLNLLFLFFFFAQNRNLSSFRNIAQFYN